MPEEPQEKRRLPDPLTGAFEYMVARQHERRERIVKEILANRRGEYRVPTWVLVLALFAMIGAIILVFAVT
jgi:hypothetical protein